ncbi:MAG: hypothetical protein UZ03_NOB001002839 [Nitrospira sp. OLB3]|nr:MAG: hypothetical protein UZ03_NOB001002839 [Nitrospira sp. OLB3]
MHPQQPPSPLRQDLKIAARLRRLDDAKRIPLAGHRHVCGILASQLEEEAGVRPSFIGLSRGMEEPRAEPHAGGDAFDVPYHPAHGLEIRLMRGVHFEISQQREVVAGPEPIQMGCEIRL